MKDDLFTRKQRRNIDRRRQSGGFNARPDYVQELYVTKAMVEARARDLATVHPFCTHGAARYQELYQGYLDKLLPLIGKPISALVESRALLVPMPDSLGG